MRRAGPAGRLAQTQEAVMGADDAATAGERLGRRFVAAIAARDAATLAGLFGSEVDFRAMTPGRVWEARTPAQAVDEVILGNWFGPGDVVERIEWVHTAPVGSRHGL